MIYDDYKKARDYAWAILKLEKISSFPVPIVQISNKFGVYVKNFNPKHGEKGIIINLFGRPHIFVDRKLPDSEKRYIIAHELGHFLLGHMKYFESLMYYDYRVGKHPFEDEASSFATRLLSPSCVLDACNCQSYQDVEQLCGIPKKIAKMRISRLKTLRKRNKFLTSNLEKEVFENFQDFIKSNTISSSDGNE